jgi:hypothetical protein
MQNVFKNQTTNITSSTYRVKGKIQVNVSGVLGGADVITYYIGANGALTPLKTCSWRASISEDINDGADGGEEELLGETDIIFKIINAGMGTNINLEFYGEKMG